MKKHVKVLSVLLMATMIVFALAACGGKSGESKVNGKTYAFESCTEDGQDATETIKAMYSEQTFEFKDDGVCVQTLVWAGEMAELMGTDPVVQNGTYEENGDTVKVTFKVDGEEDLVMEFTADSDTLKLAEEGTEMIYKVKS